MPGKNKRGGRGYTKNPRARKLERFGKKYGMTMSEWAKLKKKDPEEVKKIRLKISLRKPQ